MKALILAAGVGSRLGMPHPKPLTRLTDGRSIMDHQIKELLRYVNIHDIYVMAGYKKDLIMEAFPDLIYIYNDRFDTTNTSQSLLRGIRKLQGHDVLWLNGDVIFDHRVILSLIEHQGSCMAVNSASCGEEEVKYLTAKDGSIIQVSKEIKKGLGEALGINKINKNEIALLIKWLEACKESDYFEKGIELAIEKGLKIYPVDVSGFNCIEIDFIEDLERVNRQLVNKR